MPKKGGKKKKKEKKMFDADKTAAFSLSNWWKAEREKEEGNRGGGRPFDSHERQQSRPLLLPRLHRMMHIVRARLRDSERKKVEGGKRGVDSK